MPRDEQLGRKAPARQRDSLAAVRRALLAGVMAPVLALASLAPAHAQSLPIPELATGSAKALVLPPAAPERVASETSAVPVEGDERARLLAERERLKRRFDEAEAGCASRFAVNACLDDARSARRAALRPVNERLLSLDAEERQTRALSRLAVRNQAAQAGRGAPPPGDSLFPPVSRASRAASAPPPAPVARAPGAASAAEAAQRQQQAQERQRANERAQAALQRERTYQALQADIARRQAEQAANPRRSAPLPSTAASASR